MHPFVVQSIAAERARDLLKAAQRNRDASPARERAEHQRRLPPDRRHREAARLLADQRGLRS
jgi:hypothetical protein